METNAGAVTSKVLELVTEPERAVMAVVPATKLEARPAPFTLAIAGADELHVTELVRSRTLPSVYVPIAVNACVRPAATLAGLGETAIDTRAGGLTVSAVEFLTAPEVAVIFAIPIVPLVANPPGTIDATRGVSEDQTAEAVKSWTLPSV
jgi:hypothetical protein